MNRSSSPRLFPWVTLFLGLVGLALQFWLFSCEDRAGLLPHSHISQTLTFVLFAINLALCIPAMKRVDTSVDAGKLFPPSRLAGICGMVGALLILFSGAFGTDMSLYSLILRVSTILFGLALLCLSYFRYTGTAANPYIYYAALAFLILQTLFRCREWNADTQSQRFIFQLFGLLFFMFSMYYRARLSILGNGHKQQLFFTQAALYCLCVGIAGENSLCNLGASLWLVAESAPKGDCV